MLRPHESYTERFLLNFGHTIDAPSEYWVEATHSGSGLFKNTDDVPQTRLTFRVEEAAVSPRQLRPWLEALQSPDREERIEAARILASLAPPSLEAVLVRFAANPEFRRFAPLALHRLNTPRSLEAMAALMQGSFTGEQVDAARYLAETQDQRWYPLLREAAVEHSDVASFPAYAAELGGEQALPMLIALAQSPDREFTGGNAIMALGSTGSRNAVPVLLEYLDSPDANLSDRASYALRLLTRRTVAQAASTRNRQIERTLWLRWWRREGATAPIFKDRECGELIPLH